MASVYVVYRDGDEDPVAICTSEKVAKAVISECYITDSRELGYIIDYWVEEQNLIESEEEATELYGYWE